ncbi:Hypothetical predicted protein [Marmota monax]|uniref:G-protein coupled receptors family 1 profile domain-containing protein n=1 Tax=Marmota monax TaxID=9995 RepID=A0A5E4A734_MARMO|nr:hypothetical protein GHT09_004590 [Marmota monax]VTJ52924.1 Hypothetical predicted protein [Marmota monax]
MFSGHRASVTIKPTQAGPYTSTGRPSSQSWSLGESESSVDSVDTSGDPRENGSHDSLAEGLSEDPELQPLIFGLFLFVYLVTVLGNLLIIMATISDSHVHTPMYFFLSNLSFVDICITSTTIPKMLVNIQMQSKTIT